MPAGVADFRVLLYNKKDGHPSFQTEDKWAIYALEIAKKAAVYFLCKAEVHCIFIRNRDFYCIFKGFEEKLRLPYSCKATLVFLQNYPHFSQSVSVCRLCLQTDPPEEIWADFLWQQVVACFFGTLTI